MNAVDILGIVASITSVSGFLPQIYKIHQTKRVQDLSFLMLLNCLLCSVAWVAYGFLTQSPYVWMTNSAGFCASSILIAQKRRYQK